MFFGYDEKGKLKHACMRETDGGKGKRDIPRSDKKFAFRLASFSENSSVFVFESAIDLLSFATEMYENGADYHRENLISLSGIYLPKRKIEESKIPLPLEYYLQTHPNTERICLYLDNDFAGHRGADALQVILGERYEVRCIPPPVGKDYNDYLQIKKKTKTERKPDYENSDQER